MADLGAIEQDVAFDWGKAEELSSAFTSTAGVLESQLGERESARSQARREWRGRYGDEFDSRVAICRDDGARLVTSLREAASGLDELARLAGEEQSRRERARVWVAEQEGGSGWGPVGDVVESVGDLLFGGDQPPPPPEVAPPSIPIGDPGSSARDQAQVTAVSAVGSRGTSSAVPADLDEWVSATEGMDEAISWRRGQLVRLHDEFTATLGWGHFDASSLLSGLGTWLSWNGTDAAWVANVAGTFREADSGTVPDAAIEAGLTAVGLDTPRTSVTYDDPALWGEAPTSGYADDPVNTASGNFVEVEVDLECGGSCRLLRFARTYNSRSDRVGPFGRGWGSLLTCRLQQEPGGVRWVGLDGQEVVVVRDPSADGVRLPGLAGEVVADGDGLVVHSLDGSRFGFGADGLPVWMQEGPGTRVRFVHDQGRVAGLVHESGRAISVDWDAGGERITGLRCSDGRSLTYRYDDAGRLVEVVGGPRGRRRYEPDDVGRVVAVVDADGVVEALNTYDDEGRVLAQKSPLGRRTRYRYLGGRVTVVDDDEGGPSNSYVHDDQGRLVELFDGHGARLCKVYDGRGNPTSITERDGSVSRMEWDERGRLIRRIAADGSSFAFAYDEQDRVVEVTAPDGATVRNRYEGTERTPVEVVDAAGGVTRREVRAGLVRRVVDPDGVEFELDHDSSGELVAVTDGDGNRTTIERDPVGRPTAVVTPCGLRTELAYDEAGRVVERREPGGAVWRYRWSPGGRLVASTDPLGGRRAWRYGRSGELEERVDELGHTATRRLDAFGNLVGLVGPGGEAWELGHDPLGRLISLRDPSGATWLREHDVVGNLTALVDPTGGRREVTRDGLGRIAAMSDGATSVAFEHDALGRPRVVRRADGSETRLDYDGCGRLVSVTGPDGATSRLRYTPGGRLATVTSPLGHTTRYDYDRCGRRVAMTDPLGRRWSYRHDADGRVVETEAPTGDRIVFRYDDAGRLSARVSSAGGATTYTYDARGRLVAVTGPAGGVRRFVWNARGELAEAIDPNGGVVRFERDERGLVRSMVDQMGGRVEHDVDPIGRLVERRDQLGRSTRWEYDAAGRLVRRVLASGQAVRWWYDGSGRLSGLGDDDHDEPVVRAERDRSGRPVAVTEPRYRHELEWDHLGRLVARRRNGVGLSWRYDADGRRTAVVYPDGCEVRYTFDAAGRPVSVSSDQLGVVSLGHDAAGRLVDLRTGDRRQWWRYRDGRLAEHGRQWDGRRQVTDLARDASGRVVTATSDGVRRTFGYDRAGQLVSTDGPGGGRAFRYDPAGRLVAESTPRGEASYEYDAAHQLIQRRAPCGTPYTYDYDAAGRRVRETGLDGTVREIRWDWLGHPAALGRVGVRVDALGDLASVDGRELAWDPTVPVPQLRWLDGTRVVGADRPWATLGSDGSVDWLDADRWAAGADAWGPAPDPAEPGDLTWDHRGELTVGGLAWLRNRVYDPVTRTFLSTDPLPGIPGEAQSANAYAYAGNDPVGTADPLGLRPLTDADLQTYHAAMNQGMFAGVGDVLSTGGRYLLGGSMTLVGGAAALTTTGNPLAPLVRVLPEPLRPIVVAGSPLHAVTGGGQAVAALIAGETDPGDLARHFVNGPSTTVGQGLAFMGGGDLSYNDHHGIWTSEATADWTHGRGGTAYGSVFVTSDTQHQVDQRHLGNPQGSPSWDELLTHEAVHSDQWSRYGGGVVFPILYGIEEWRSGGGANNCFEQEAGLEHGGYGQNVTPGFCY